MTSEIQAPEATPGAKMMYLIKRRPTTSREELIANWFANHMPDVIVRQAEAAEQGRLAARRYIATVYDSPPAGEQVWDGIAQLWFDEALPQPKSAHGSTPRDTFQEKAEPYVPWATTEHIVMDGELPLAPNTLNDPFPCTRSGFLKISALIKTNAGVDHAEFFDHWLTTHAANVKGVMEQVGGFRYVINLSIDPEIEHYAGLAELYFANKDGLRQYGEIFVPDGMDHWVDRPNSDTMWASTEMVGIA